MPGAGTDKTKRWIERPGPVVVLVEPQMGENIGAAARAMANFGLGRLRLVKPKQGWPNEKAVVMAAGADRVLDGAQLYETLEEAVADCSFVLATTARHHDQLKPIIGAQQAAAEIAPRVAAGDTVALVFGRERNGLENHEVGLADRIVTTAPDVTVSTNLGPWVNRRGLFAREAMADTFKSEQIPSTFNWEFSPKGQHIELGIAESNLFINLSALGLSHSINGVRLLPIGTLYDPFIARGLDQLNYGCYQDSRFMVVATPSGITLAGEGGAHRPALDGHGAGWPCLVRAGFRR